MKRILSAVVLLPIAVLGVLYAPPVLYLAGIGVIGSLCLHEYFGLVRSLGIRVQPLFGHAAFWILLVALRQGRFATVVLFALVLLGAFLSAMWRRGWPMRDRALALMAESLGLFYFTLFLYPALPIRYDFGADGMPWTVILLAVIWTGDSAALLAGKTVGRTRFAPELSPKKTNEGALAGLLAGVGIAVLLERLLFPALPLGHVIAASALAGAFGQLGDLAESMLKRAEATKDSSQLIPGHGGALDRMDSLLFAFPVLYFYLTFFC